MPRPPRPRIAPPLREYFAWARDAVRRQVSAIDADYLLAGDLDLIHRDLVEQCFPTPIEVDWAAATRVGGIAESTRAVTDAVTQRPLQLRQSTITFSYPIHGSAEMLSYTASRSSSAPLPGTITGGHLTHAVTSEENLTQEYILRALKTFRDEVSTRVTWANNDLEVFLDDAVPRARNALVERRERLLAERRVIDALPIPVQSAGGPPTVPAQRRLVPLEERRAAAEFTPHPVLAELHYRDIVTGIRHWARQTERTPLTSNKLGEEDRRNTLLAALNMHWTGQAAGELFNNLGKTDILIREDDRNVFIGECKNWGGPASVTGAIDQIFRYLTYRDTKAAVLVFIENADPGRIISRLHQVVAEDPRCERFTDAGDGQYDYLFASGDGDKRVQLAVIPIVLRTAGRG